jgi:hypothetical protein
MVALAIVSVAYVLGKPLIDGMFFRHDKPPKQ